jgi:hypothetical protein
VEREPQARDASQKRLQIYDNQCLMFGSVQLEKKRPVSDPQAVHSSGRAPPLPSPPLQEARREAGGRL